MTETPSSERQVLINLVASLCLADHMGDAMEDALEALKQIGITPPSILDFEDDGQYEYDGALMRWLGKEHAATTVYGTSVLDD
jgi:hypothetical protein